MKKIYHQQTGDTIIEVLLAIAVIGLVLTISYTTVNRSLRAARSAQEQTQALKLAESQIERIKYVAGLNNAPNSDNDVFDTRPGRTTFCVDSSFNKAISGSSAYNTNCRNIDVPAYEQSVTYDQAGNLFRATVTWQTINGSTGRVQVSYKLYRQP
jgi:type II secretory pathway pseudopilin PulG